MKTCSLCKEEKDLELFKKDNRRSDCRSSNCKECMRIKGLEYHHRTKIDRIEKINENRRASYYRNKVVENERSKKYKEDNKEKIKEYNKNYLLNNKESLKEKAREYKKRNKEKIKLYSRNYSNDKLKNDIIFKLRHYSRSMIRKSLNGRFTKKSKTQDILGCSFEEFKLYLEKYFEDWMTWENRGLYNGELNYGWDIDHIIPLASAVTEEDILKLNHYKNLKPLCSYINRVVKRDFY